MHIGLLRSVVTELAERIAGARVAKIHQPAADLFILRLWTGRQNLSLLISAAPRESRIHLTEKSFPNPFTPPRFCQLLRSRVSRIAKVQLANDDRIVVLDCLGPKGECQLVVELTGKSSNLILVNSDGLIIDSLKRQADDLERCLSAGQTYSYPVKRSPATQNRPTVDENVPGPEGFSMFVEKLYSDGRSSGSTTDLRSRLVKILDKEQKRMARRLKNIEQEASRQQDFEHYRQLGDLLLANMHLLKRGMAEVSLVNYYLQPPDEVSVPLNTLLSPQQNAEKYFQKYKKARRGVEHSVRRKAETDRELEWLAQLDYQLKSAQQPADIALVADELKRAGVLKEAVSKLPRTMSVKKADFHETHSPGGFRILWGTNSRQNDALSTRELKKGDLWFHAHRCPGSHVVLKSDSGKGPFEEADIVCAASIAAAHSKAKEEQKVEVMVVAAKEVKKPPGAKPGMVTVQQYKTLMVKPYSDNPDVF